MTNPTTDLASLVYVPGLWRCAKCKLDLIASVLSPGGVSANEAPQTCPNECGPMWRVTERAQRQEAQKLFNEQFDQLSAFRTERDKLAEALRSLSFAAQTSGGVAGRDEQLVAAIEQAEVVLRGIHNG